MFHIESNLLSTRRIIDETVIYRVPVHGAGHWPVQNSAAQPLRSAMRASEILRLLSERANKPTSLQASSKPPPSLQASKPPSLQAYKPPSLQANKPPSQQASKPPSLPDF